MGDVLGNTFAVSGHGRAVCRVAELLEAFDDRLPQGAIVAAPVHQYESVGIQCRGLRIINAHNAILHAPIYAIRSSVGGDEGMGRLCSPL